MLALRPAAGGAEGPAAAVAPENTTSSVLQVSMPRRSSTLPSTVTTRMS
jgi:hypothetical protein